MTTAPNPTPSRPILSPWHGLSVLLAGAVILFIEIAGSKLLAVVFGSSLYVWSALISVTLFSIALGAWWGGKVADRLPDPRTLGLLYLGAGLTLGLAVPLRQLAFPFADHLDLRVGTFLSAMMLFFLPLALLAAVTPVAIKLSSPAPDHLGRTVGWISALGTAGSCFGALATGYFLVPSFPLSRLFLGLSFLLVLFGVAQWGGRSKLLPLLFLGSWGACLALLSSESHVTALGRGNALIELETRQNLYGQTQILQAQDLRLLFLDGILQGGIQVGEGRSVAEYTGTMEVLGCSAVPKAKKALVIGLGAGILPSSLRRRGLEVTAVDINPQVVDLYKKWFDPDFPTAALHAEDGRRFLKRSKEAYDLIFLDVYSGEEVPFHLLTQESFEGVRERLAEGGALVMNYVGTSDVASSRVLATLLATLGTAFPSPEAFTSADSGKLANIILVARKAPGGWAPSPDVLWSEDRRVSLASTLTRKVSPAEPFPYLFTDDHCPIEFLDRKVRYTWRREKIKMMRLSLQG